MLWKYLVAECKMSYPWLETMKERNFTTKNRKIKSIFVPTQLDRFMAHQ